VGYNILEKDVVMGVFTHRVDYLSNLISSIKEFLPNIQFIVNIADGSINENMEKLRQDFLCTNKRFWVFLDDDIKFLNSSIIRDAVSNLLKHRFGMVGVYSTFDPGYKLGSDKIECREVGWVPGYFMMVDSKYLSHIKPDMNLPDSCTAIDTSYCISVKAEGYKIGVSPSVVYHKYKKVWMNKEAYDKTVPYIDKKWGDFYNKNCVNQNIVVGEFPPIDILEKNKQKLIEWQSRRYNRIIDKDSIRLNLGCGDTKYPSYVNTDKDTCDFTKLPNKDNTIDEISIHHALEHIPQIYFKDTLQQFYNKLKPDGYLDIGIPDLELVCKKYIDSKDHKERELNTYFLYGWQRKMDNTSDLLDENQIHKGGLSKKDLMLMLKDIGFNIIECYNYNGNGTPSVFAFAQK